MPIITIELNMAAVELLGYAHPSEGENNQSAECYVTEENNHRETADISCLSINVRISLRAIKRSICGIEDRKN